MSRQRYVFWWDWHVNKAVPVQLERLRGFSRSVENSIADQAQDLQRILRNELSKSDPGYEESVAESFHEENQQYQVYYPQILRQTSFIGTMSFLEHTLVMFCQHYEHIEGREFYEPQETLKKAKKYLFKKLEGTLEQEESDAACQDWETIMKYSKLRNWLVHFGSQLRLGMGHANVQEKAKVAKSAIDQLAFVDLLSSGEITLHDEFCGSVLSVVERFLGIVRRLPWQR